VDKSGFKILILLEISVGHFARHINMKKNKRLCDEINTSFLQRFHNGASPRTFLLNF